MRATAAGKCSSASSCPVSVIVQSHVASGDFEHIPRRGECLEIDATENGRSVSTAHEHGYKYHLS